MGPARLDEAQGRGIARGPDPELRAHPPRLLLCYLMGNYTLTRTEAKKGFSVKQNLP